MPIAFSNLLSEDLKWYVWDKRASNRSGCHHSPIYASELPDTDETKANRENTHPGSRADFFCLTWISVMMKNYFLLYNNLKTRSWKSSHAGHSRLGKNGLDYLFCSLLFSNQENFGATGCQKTNVGKCHAFFQ